MRNKILKRRLTLCEHRDLGRRRQAACNSLLHQHVDVANKSGNKSLMAKKMGRVVKIFLALRCDIEDICWRDHPEYQGPSLYLGVTAEKQEIARDLFKVKSTQIKKQLSK